MKKLLLSTIFLLLVVLSFAQVSVRGYYRSNGTYVQPHMRSSPDSNPYNNYSYPGNTNPYTGKVATGNPDTYLNNYYNKSDNSKYNSSSSNYTGSKTKYSISDKTILNNGGYLLFSQKQETYTVYDIYDSSNVYDGFIAIYPNNTARLFNKQNTLVRTIDYFKSNSLTILNEAPTYTPPSSASPTISNSTKRIYLKNDKGNYTGFYFIQYYEDEVVTKYNLYDNLDKHIGVVSDFINGERCLYDLNGKLILRKQIK